MKVFGWDSVKLSDAYTFDELRKLREQVEAQHANPKDERGYLEGGRPTLYLYDKQGRKKLDAIAWAVRHRMERKSA